MRNKMPYFNARTLFNGLAISYIFYLNGTSFWISGILGALLGVIILLKVPNVTKNKYINGITGFILATLAMTILVNMGHTLYLENTPLMSLTVFPLICVLIMTCFKERAIKQVINILFCYSLVLFLLKMLSLFPQIQVENLRPLFSTNIKNIIFGALVVALTGTVPILALDELEDRKSVVINYSISMATIITIMFLAIGVLGDKEAVIYRYPEYVMLKKINFLNFISNVDHFFSFAITADLLFTTYQGLKKIELLGKKAKYLGAFLIAIVTILICDLNYPISIIYHYFPFVLIFLLILLLIPKK